MVDWKSSAESMHDATIYVYMAHALVGLYFWELVNSFGLEWEILSGKRRFRWPMISYFAGRYSLVASMIGSIIALDVESRKLHCRALWVSIQAFGEAAVGFSTINLSMRVIAIWNHDRYIVGLIGALVLGHWFLMFRSLPLDAEFIPGLGCAATTLSKTFIAAHYVYTMMFDLVILALSVYKLGVSFNEGNPPLVTLLFRDGVAYFVIVILFNILSVTFMLLDLNPIMRTMFGLPAGVVSVIASSRAVRRLHHYVTPTLGVGITIPTSNPYLPSEGWRHASPRTGTTNTSGGGSVATRPTDHRIQFAPLANASDTELQGRG
ncbi:hypothetical protein PUNSTDRAFT_116302 [Punctularia strigosozonata HHB-11173 SS5]|uniref:Uncharacterized protein n=1 Tax=Punctularia strigosozonata (strain HHB-11173) TaxID=741275 RepID=R7S5F7_PUNST|nr:uncharacterized protein PUNSTDRAFT_116302 [Punctularia strigosozonata HHB-11173 SS5]EIN04631.1 hypothetical protein PUNSTDRAFT_116302 [Punctularia strigosozonata HHB-11173 SS5]